MLIIFTGFSCGGDSVMGGVVPPRLKDGTLVQVFNELHTLFVQVFESEKFR